MIVWLQYFPKPETHLLLRKMTIYRATATSRNRFTCVTAKYHNLVGNFA